MDGWFKMHRKIIESPVFDNPEALKLWVWILSKASHKEHTLMVGNKTVTVKAGELVFGRRIAARALRMTESKVYRLLKTIENSGMIEVKPNNKFSVINVVNWGFYQGTDGSKRTTNEQQTNNSRTTKEQQTNTNKNVKECIENVGERKEIGASPTSLSSSMTKEEYDAWWRDATE